MSPSQQVLECVLYRFNPIQFCFQRKPTPHHTKLSPAPRRVASCRSRDTSTNISVQCRPSQVATCSAAQPVIVCRINASMCYFSYFWGELGSNVFRPLGFGHLFGFRQKPDWQRRQQASWPRDKCFFFLFGRITVQDQRSTQTRFRDLPSSSGPVCPAPFINTLLQWAAYIPRIACR